MEKDNKFEQYLVKTIADKEAEVASLQCELSALDSTLAAYRQLTGPTPKFGTQLGK